MPQYNFGTGLLTFTPPGANPSPIPCGVLQDVTLDIDQTIKELVGQYKTAVDAALANQKFSGKATHAQIFGAAMASILQGSVQTTGSTRGSQNEVWAIPTTPFQVTVANSATFVEDLSVYNVTASKLLTRVASSPATGQYSVSAGVYTFAAADTGNTVWISYSYTSTSGVTVAYSNQLMGSATTFGLTLYNQYTVQGVVKYFGWKLYAVIVPKLSFAFKNVDYTMQNTDFQGFANSAGKIMDYYTSE